MASLREYYRKMAEENARLQEELRQARAEQGDSAEKAEAYDDPIDIEPCPYTYEETDIPIDDNEEPTDDQTVGDTLQIPTQEEDDEFQETLNYYIDGIKKGYISSNDVPLKYREKITEYLE